MFFMVWFPGDDFPVRLWFRLCFGSSLQGKFGLLGIGIAVGATGIFLAADAGYNFFTTGWLLVLEVIYLVVLLLCVPLLGHALGRIEIEALKSRKRGAPTDELQELLNDNVPVVLCLVILFLIPVMVWLAEFKAF